MGLLGVLGVLLAIYISGMFILPVLFIPNLGWKWRFRKNEIPSAVLHKMQLIGKSGTKREVLKKALDFQFTKFYSQTRQVFLQCNLWFMASFSKLWKKGGFIHCHQHGLVLRYLLIASGRFTEKDIKIRITHYFFNIHQYLMINVGEKGKKEWICVDPFAYGLGQPIGEVLSKDRKK